VKADGPEGSSTLFHGLFTPVLKAGLVCFSKIL
jgi:hypothetical protein